MSKSKTVWATIVGILSSVFAFLGLIGCCGLPILAGVLAWLGIGASQLSFFAAYRWWFIGFAIVALLFGFWQVYFRKNKSCCETTENSCCSTDNSGKSKSQLFQKIFLWIGAVIIAVMLIIGFKENSAVNASNDGCCPGEEVIQNNSGCCPGEEIIQENSGCCPEPEPILPKKEVIQTGCCPQ